MILRNHTYTEPIQVKINNSRHDTRQNYRNWSEFFVSFKIIKMNKRDNFYVNQFSISAVSQNRAVRRQVEN